MRTSRASVYVPDGKIYKKQPIDCALLQEMVPDETED
jgi:hypothetical protein